MNQHELGIALALLERLRLSRIPRLLPLHDARRLQPQWRLFSEFGPIFGGLARLYHEITTPALANEHAWLSATTLGSIDKV